MDNPVGPILRMGDDVEDVVAAIEEDNPGREIEVIDRGAYVRVQAPDHLVVTADTLKRHLGDDFDITQLQGMLASFAGRIYTWSDRVEWSFKTLGAPETAGTGA